MAKMKEYNESNPPQRGTALRIWRALKRSGWTVSGLRYNPNLWGRGGVKGWGTWACEIWNERHRFDCWCGVDSQGIVYLEGPTAPYARVRVERENAN